MTQLIKRTTLSGVADINLYSEFAITMSGPTLGLLFIYLGYRGRLLCVRRSIVKSTDADETDAEKAQDTSAGTNDGQSPLYVAGEKGNIEVARLLIAAGADVNLSSQNGTSALYAAASTGQPEMCRFLLENGASVDQLASGAHSPLYVAAQNGHAEVATILLDSGATVNLSTAAG